MNISIERIALVVIALALVGMLLWGQGWLD